MIIFFSDIIIGERMMIHKIFYINILKLNLNISYFGLKKKNARK